MAELDRESEKETKDKRVLYLLERRRERERVCVHVSERERAKERDCWQWYITTFRVFKSEFLRFSSSLRRPTPQGTLLKRFC